MWTDIQKEKIAAKVLNDEGLALPLRLLGGKYLRLIMRIPTLESRVRMAKMFLQIGVKYDELKTYNYEDKQQFMIDHSVNVSRMVAYGIVRGAILGRLCNRPVAWMLRNYMHPVALEEAWMIINSVMSTIPFENIIRLAEVTNILAPSLSQERNGS